MGKRKRKSKPIPKTQTRTPWARRLSPGVVGLAVVAGVGTWYFLFKQSPVSDAAQYRGGPRLVVDKDFIDFGTVRFEKFVRASFRLRNVGDQALRLPAYPPVDVVEGC
jgi:hypothetical protein